MSMAWYQHGALSRTHFYVHHSKLAETREMALWERLRKGACTGVFISYMAKQAKDLSVFLDFFGRANSYLSWVSLAVVTGDILTALKTSNLCIL